MDSRILLLLLPLLVSPGCTTPNPRLDAGGLEGEGEGEGEGAEGEGEGTEGEGEGEGTEGEGEGEGEGAEGEGEGTEGEGEGEGTEGEGEGEGGEGLGFAEPCQRNADCASGRCVETAVGSVCTRPCNDDCPEGWECKTVTDVGSDLLNLCVPLALEICDGRDNDRDGLVDEDLVAPEALKFRGVCSGQKMVCAGSQGWVEPDYHEIVEYSEIDNLCDGKDNDCDGSTDENYIPMTIECGIGACFADGFMRCANGELLNDCSPGSPEANDARCNGLDDDCDGETDEDYLIVEGCGYGDCRQRSTASSCVDGIEIPCVPGLPNSDNDSTCNGIDDDCDGEIDEDYVIDRSCGVGYCRDNNTPSACSRGLESPCFPSIPLYLNDTSCDGIDDDCDGEFDEDFIADISCGIGECQVDSQCIGGSEVCIPNEPQREVLDGLDNDCDGKVDDDLPSCRLIRNINDTGIDLEFCEIVPAGGGVSFWMGCREDLNGDQWNCRQNDQPQHIVSFDIGFEMMRTEVTVDHYRACVESNYPGCIAIDSCEDAEPNYQVPGSGSQPVNCVTRPMAQAFARWVGASLPLEAEWEYAARGPMLAADDYFPFPWRTSTINCARTPYGGCADSPLAVGSHSPQGDSPFAIADLAGNLAEWTQDCYHASYDGAPGDGSAWDVDCASDGAQVIRGGSWQWAADLCQVSNRYGLQSSRQHSTVGFRLVRRLF